VFARLEARGDTDPADFLSSIVHNKAEAKEHRIQAAGLLMPYKYSKRGLTSEPPPLVYVEHSVELPHPMRPTSRKRCSTSST
jgi:hypothetical protein